MISGVVIIGVTDLCVSYWAKFDKWGLLVTICDSQIAKLHSTCQVFD